MIHNYNIYTFAFTCNFYCCSLGYKLLFHCHFIYDKMSVVNPYSTELVFQITSHFQHWRLYCIYFGHRSLSLPQTWLLFRHGALTTSTNLLTKRFVGLNKMQCSPSFDWNWGKQNDPTACWYQTTSYTHDFRFYSKGNTSGTHQSVWAGSLKPQFVWAARGLCTLRTPINGGTSL